MIRLFRRPQIHQAQHQPPPDPLARPLLHFSPHDPWTVRDACEGTQVFGATGSGKTSGSGQAIAKAFLRAGFGGLILTAKPDEAALWRRYCAETGREDQLAIISPATGAQLNFLDYELRRPGAGAGLTENLVSLFCTVAEAAERGGGGSGIGGDRFWMRALRQLLRNAIDLIVMSGGDLSLTKIHRVIAEAPQYPEEVESEEWRESSLCWHCLCAADQGLPRHGRPHDLDATARYWLREFPSLDDRTRPNIVSTFTTMADGFLRDPLRQMFTTGTTFVPEMTHQGALLLVDMPVKEYHDLGRYAQVLIKYLWQRATERRDVSRHPMPVFLWADEAQNFVTSHDQNFQTTARSSRACTVYLTQNISNYYASIGGGDPRSLTDSLLGNLQTKVFHANGDSVTNEWAERLFAKSWSWRTSTNTGLGSGGSQGQQAPHTSAGANQSLESEVLAREFTVLKKGGPDSGFQVEGIVFQGGRTWRASGKTHLRALFPQNE